MTSINFKKLLEQERRKALNAIKPSTPAPPSQYTQTTQLPYTPLASALGDFTLTPYPRVLHWDEYKVGIVDSVYYLPDYITTSEEEQLKLQVSFATITLIKPHPTFQPRS